MAWTDIPQYIIDDILGFQNMNQIVDNFNYLFVGSAGQAHVDTDWLTNLAVTTAKIDALAVTAAKIGALAVETAKIDALAVTEAKLAANAVSQTKIKTSTGTASGTIAGTPILINMQEYTFYPNVYGADTEVSQNASTQNNTGTVGRLALVNPGANHLYAVNWRYVTATDEPFIYAIQGANGEIEHVWMCEDPPAGYWGLDEKPDNFEAPITILNEDKTVNTLNDKTEIIIFKHPKDEYFEIVNRSEKDNKQPHEILNDKFEYDSNKKVFKSKNILAI